MKRKYIIPQAEAYSIDVEEALLVRFSQVDNDGDGKTDQRPIIEGDPEDGEIGSKEGWFSNDFDI
ncbi:hypothetical protein CTI16_09655 [Prevotella intermedia]|uniref:Uncharacterized protein n=1 Tax=Prevotella intermedia TaxID=28131 RepID=A0AAJ3RHP9_PREIN|nr:hypothetical protein CTI16_09655 [Prevotella intermedia]